MKEAGGESGTDVAGDSVGATCSIGDVIWAFSGGSSDSSSTAGGCGGNSLGSLLGTSTAGSAAGREQPCQGRWNQAASQASPQQHTTAAKLCQSDDSAYRLQTVLTTLDFSETTVPCAVDRRVKIINIIPFTYKIPE